jgi:hypothetical protein
LTAANMNISAGTGVPVFATTVTRDAAFGGTSEKVLAEGQLCYLSSTNVVQYYDGAAWASVGASGGMTLLSTTTLSGASTTISSIDQTYVQLYGVITGVTNATADGQFRIGPNGSTTGNYYQGVRLDGLSVGAVAGANAYWDLSMNNYPSRTNANNSANFLISNYASSTSYKNMTWSLCYNTEDVNFGSSAYFSNTAITSLTFTNSGGSFSTGTVLLYGVK